MEETLWAARLVLYALFQKAFGAEPDDVLFDLVKGEVASEACDVFAAELDEEEGRMFRAAFDRLRVDAATAWTRSPEGVRADYTRLFVGPAALPAPPWESVHRQGALFQTSTLEVRRAYAAQGLAAEGSPRVADDHLAMELDFMRTLCSRALASLRSGDVQCAERCIEAQRTFLDEHLLVWTGSFAAALAREEASVYAGSGTLLALFVQLDRGIAARHRVR